MAQQKIDLETQVKGKLPSSNVDWATLPGTVIGSAFPDSGWSNNTSSNVYITDSNVSFTIDKPNSSVLVLASLSLSYTKSGDASQGVIELRSGANGGGARLTRVVPPSPGTFAVADISQLVTGLSPGSYTYSLVGRVSVGVSIITLDSTSVPSVAVMLVS